MFIYNCLYEKRSESAFVDQRRQDSKEVKHLLYHAVVEHSVEEDSLISEIVHLYPILLNRLNNLLYFPKNQTLLHQREVLVAVVQVHHSLQNSYELVHLLQLVLHRLHAAYLEFVLLKEKVHEYLLYRLYPDHKQVFLLRLALLQKHQTLVAVQPVPLAYFGLGK